MTLRLRMSTKTLRLCSSVSRLKALSGIHGLTRLWEVLVRCCLMLLLMLLFRSMRRQQSKCGRRRRMFQWRS